MEWERKPGPNCIENGAGFQFFCWLLAGLDAKQSKGNFGRVQ